MNSLIQVEIPKRNTQCAHQGERLLPGMEIYSLLLEEKESQRLERRDFCLACWTQIRDGLEKHLACRGYWKSKIEKRKVMEGSSRIERAFTLLRSLQQEHPLKEAEIFVLCLLLSRARRLVLRQEFKNEGNLYHLYEIIRKEEFLTVKVVSLSHVQIENLQKSLAEQLLVVEA